MTVQKTGIQTDSVEVEWNRNPQRERQVFADQKPLQIKRDARTSQEKETTVRRSGQVSLKIHRASIYLRKTKMCSQFGWIQRKSFTDTVSKIGI